MFCNEEKFNGPHLPCPIRAITEVLSFLSIIFSIFITAVTKLRVKPSLINELIIQIMLSEILDGICILMQIVEDYYGGRYFEIFVETYFYCFSQIFLSVFSCLWTLTASFFISLRIYDISIKRNQIFNNKFFQKFTSILSICIPLILSFFIWFIQVLRQSSKIKNDYKEKFYNPTAPNKNHFKHMYCFVEDGVSYAVIVIVFLLIAANFYFSVIKSYKVISKISKDIDNAEAVDRNTIKAKAKVINEIKKSLLYYPLTSGIIWVVYFVFQIVIIGYKGKEYTLLSWIYCILITVRQPIYACLFLFTQPKMKEYCIKTLKCDFGDKKKAKIDYLINDVEDNSNLMDRGSTASNDN